MRLNLHSSPLYLWSRRSSWLLETSTADRSTHTFSRTPSMSSDVYCLQNRRSVFCTQHSDFYSFTFSFGLYRMWSHGSVVTQSFFNIAIQTVGKGRSLLLQAKVNNLFSNHWYKLFFFSKDDIRKVIYHMLQVTDLCIYNISGGFYRLRLWEQASCPHPFSPGFFEGSSASVTPGWEAAIA